MMLMVPVEVASWLWWAAERLLAGSLRGALIVIVVWFVCRRIAIVRASARAFLWWVASLALMTSLLPLPSVPLPLLSALPIAVSNVEGLATPLIVSQVPSEEAVPVWLIAVLAVWLVGVAVQTSRLIVAFVRLQRIVRGSRPLDPEDAAVVDRLSGLLGLKKPAVRESDRIVIPMVVGMWCPTVLLPTGGRTVLSSDERVMAICHELAHVRRSDLVFGWVPAIAERLFFFHPLVRFAAREYVAEREAACDALVLHLMDIAPRAYGEMLVHLGVGGFHPALTANGSSPTMSSLRRRLAMLDRVSSTRTRLRTIALLAALSAVVLVPFQMVARTAHEPDLRVQASPGSASPQEPAAPATPDTRTAPQPGSSRVPLKPGQKVDDERVRAALAEQQAAMVHLQEALNALRQQVEALAARDVESETARARSEQMRAMQEAEHAYRLALAQRAEDQQRAGQDQTQQFLENELRRLKAEQESLGQRSRQIADQIQQLQRTLEQVRAVKPQ